MEAFLSRRMKGEWPYLRVDAYLEVHQAGWIVSVVDIMAVAMKTTGMREIFRLTIGRLKPNRFGVMF